ncbi:MAG TPA: PEP-CTERM sorting domain-containing protein [Candidatus Binatia bacterium]|nr:PEP-CTERM sorting domain-containing protein [Candidatus Binatia bacterium]
MSFLFVTILVVPVPEPSSMVLLAFGLIGIGVVAFRRK